MLCTVRRFEGLGKAICTSSRGQDWRRVFREEVKERGRERSELDNGRLVTFVWPHVVRPGPREVFLRDAVGDQRKRRRTEK